MRERLEATVRGRVQGVGFRWFVAREAEQLGLAGWVANVPDGSVRVLAEGERADLDLLAERLAVGPAGAGVAELELAWSPAGGLDGTFTIRSGAHSGD